MNSDHHHHHHHLLEINLISAQGLKPPPASRRMQCYAVAWADPSAKVRTRTDRDGVDNPTWNDRFEFLVPAALLHPDSPSALSVEIYAAVAGWYLPDSLVGTVHLLIGNHRLLDRNTGNPSFAAVGVRCPSGRFHGVLNVAATRLHRASDLMKEALVGRSAIGYRDLMAEGSRIRCRAPPPPPPTPAAAVAEERVLKELNVQIPRKGKKGDAAIGSPVIRCRTPLPVAAAAAEERVLKELNVRIPRKGKKEEVKSDGRGALCGLRVSPSIHLSPSDENLHISWQENGVGS